MALVEIVPKEKEVFSHSYIFYLPSREELVYLQTHTRYTKEQINDFYRYCNFKQHL